LKPMLVSAAHNVEHGADVVERDVVVEQVAH
jgi:hypothetical protein